VRPQPPRLVLCAALCAALCAGAAAARRAADSESERAEAVPAVGATTDLALFEADLFARAASFAAGPHTPPQ